MLVDIYRGELRPRGGFSVVILIVPHNNGLDSVPAQELAGLGELKLQTPELNLTPDYVSECGWFDTTKALADIDKQGWHKHYPSIK